jgi:RNA polymerase sigma factor (sigma-70 family)
MDRVSIPPKLPNSEPESEASGCATQIRAAIQERHEPLLRTFAILVAKSDQRLRWPEVMEQASELLHEAVREALKHANEFDPARSVSAWIRGIGARLLLNRRRVEARARRCVAATALGEEAWDNALMLLCTASTDTAVAGRLDLEQALSRLSSIERRAIELRYYQGLDGEELAIALGVSTPGAARGRVCRALQTLRNHFRSAGEEMLS